MEKFSGCELLWRRLLNWREFKGGQKRSVCINWNVWIIFKIFQALTNFYFHPPTLITCAESTKWFKFKYKIHWSIRTNKNFSQTHLHPTQSGIIGWIWTVQSMWKKVFKLKFTEIERKLMMMFMIDLLLLPNPTQIYMNWYEKLELLKIFS